MRKPSVFPQRRIVQTALVLVALSACDSKEVGTSASMASTDSARPVVGSVGGGAATSGFAARDEAHAEKLMAREEAMAPTAAPAPAAQRNSAGAARSDVSLGTPIPAIDPTGAMLVRHGQASIEVKAVDDAVSRMRQTAAQFGGFVANTALRTGKDEERSAILQLRIPSAQFDGVVGALSQLGKVESVSVNAEDVAEEYVDLGARAANARRVEARLVELLATRTGKLSDVLTVEQELARVRQETERYDARLRWLERRASLSSLDVTIHEKLPLIDSPRGRGPILEAFAEAWQRMVGVIAWFIASLGILLPLGVIIGIGVVIGRRILRGGTPPGVPLA
ncbi:MAG TPA: DUF4349 domain-containing protein [Gemmatimonadaceae bacterium]|nr:DUF4349 domain-containing protein [Gemmatimonadaceae bacterium]